MGSLQSLAKLQEGMLHKKGKGVVKSLADSYPKRKGLSPTSSNAGCLPSHRAKPTPVSSGWNPVNNPTYQKIALEGQAEVRAGEIGSDATE